MSVFGEYYEEMARKASEVILVSGKTFVISACIIYMEIKTFKINR